MAKTPLLTGHTGAVTPEATTVTVQYFDSPVALRAKFTARTDSLRLVHKNQDDSGWEPATDDKGEVVLSWARKSVVLDVPDDYALEGVVEGAVDITKVAE